MANPGRADRQNRGGRPGAQTTLPASRAAADPERRDRLARLPTLVAEAAERWSVQLGEPYEPGRQTARVAPVTSAAGERLVLKVGWKHPEASAEADGLRFWAGNGAVRLAP
ncbi:MAG TPA: hypothetical protein VLM11_09145 [Streptosporangiaceae bacterium]|nr:hypothetical protein [Streptosporangiaceae bacterium]